MLPKSTAYVQLEKRLRITAFPEQVSLHIQDIDNLCLIASLVRQSALSYI